MNIFEMGRISRAGWSY